jgi:hypothetical protein
MLHAHTQKLTVPAAVVSSAYDMRVADQTTSSILLITGGWSTLGGVHGRGRAVALVGARGVGCFRGRVCERAAVVPDAVPGGGKDHEEEACEELDRERQVGEELVPVCQITGDEAPLHAGVAEGEGHENGGTDGRMHQVLIAQLLPLLPHPRARRGTGTARG